METQKKNYVLPIAMMFALFAMISFVTGLQNPMGIIVKNQFGASNFMSQPISSPTPSWVCRRA